VAVCAALLGLLTAVGAPAHADSASDNAERRVVDASAALEDSTAAVRAAAVSLSATTSVDPRPSTVTSMPRSK